MHEHLHEQLNALDDAMFQAVLDGNEMTIAELQHKRQQLEHLIFGDETIA